MAKYFLAISMLIFPLQLTYTITLINNAVDFTIILLVGKVVLLVEVIILSILTSKKVGLDRVNNLIATQRLKQAESELNEKARMLVSHSMLRAKQNEELKKLKEKLSQHELRGKGSLSKEVDRLIQFDNSWDDFKRHFESVHPQFFQKLAESYPKLTKNDIRHCAFIKMGMKTKEIASILNVSTRAVEKVRERMKTKLDISSTHELDTTIGAL